MNDLEISRVEELNNPSLGGGVIVLENENRSFDAIILKVGLGDMEGIRVVDDDGAYVGRTDDDGEKVVVESQKICSCLNLNRPPLNTSLLLMCSA